jgi:hypothetical protein
MALDRCVAVLVALCAGVLAQVDDVAAQQGQRPRIIVRPLSPAEEPSVVVRIGTGYDKRYSAASYAKLYAPYAQFSTLAYVDPANSGQKSGQAVCPVPSRLKGNELRWFNSLRKAGWTCVHGHAGVLCPEGQGNCFGIGGLQFHVWQRASEKGAECAVVFRGTDRNELGDWVSNFRWFLWMLPLNDQYGQVGTNIKAIVDKGCKRNVNVIAAGHSLGGGLAQHAAFNEPRFKRVYAFDSSPVTGMFEELRGDRLRDQRKGGSLVINRVHETGEILATPRYLIGGFINPRNCHPFVRTVRFNTIAIGLPSNQHAIDKLAQNMERIGRGADAKDVKKIRTEGRDCKPTPDQFPRT